MVAVISSISVITPIVSVVVSTRIIIISPVFARIGVNSCSWGYSIPIFVRIRIRTSIVIIVVIVAVIISIYNRGIDYNIGRSIGTSISAIVITI
jgi:hypothetical protein